MGNGVKFVFILFGLLAISLSFVSAGISVSPVEKIFVEEVDSVPINFKTTGINGEPVGEIKFYGPIESTELVRDSYDCDKLSCEGTFTLKYDSSIDGNGGTYIVEIQNPSMSVGIKLTFGFDPANLKCTDSDAGDNPKVQGTLNVVTLNGESEFTDYCHNVQTKSPWYNWNCEGDDCPPCRGDLCGLREAYCVGKEMTYRDYECPDGCKDGVCLGVFDDKPKECEGDGCFDSDAKCSDSDEGVDYYTKGTIKYFYDVSEDNFYGWHIQEDQCSRTDSNVLYELSCDYYDSHELNPSKKVECSNGCVNGACVRVTGDKGCTDSDGGIDIYSKGQINGEEDGLSFEKIDNCIEIPYGRIVLQENFCYTDYGINYEEGNGAILQIECSQGCENGTCIGDPKEVPKCEDSDKGKDYFTKGVVKGPQFTGFEKGLFEKNSFEDFCTEKDGNELLAEYFCRNGFVVSESYICPRGCNDGKCVGKDEFVEPEEDEPIEIPGIDEDNGINYFCSGCELDKKCYPFGYRKDGKYCSDDFEFIGQFEGDSICENNFECDSNVCISGQCISQGLLQKILNWFKRLF